MKLLIPVKLKKHFPSPVVIRQKGTEYIRKQCNRLSPKQQLFSVVILTIIFVFLSMFSIVSAILHLSTGNQNAGVEHITYVLPAKNNHSSQNQ